jgi:hypothetical protein
MLKFFLPREPLIPVYGVLILGNREIRDSRRERPGKVHPAPSAVTNWKRLANEIVRDGARQILSIKYEINLVITKSRRLGEVPNDVRLRLQMRYSLGTNADSRSRFAPPSDDPLDDN